MKRATIIQSILLLYTILIIVFKLSWAQDLSSPVEEEPFEMVEYDLNGPCLSADMGEALLPDDDSGNMIGSGLSSSFSFSGMNNIDEVVVSRTVNTATKSSPCGGESMSTVGASIPVINTLNWYLNLNRPNQQAVDPCAVAKEIEKILNDANVKQKNEELRQKTSYEYAFTHQLNLNTNAVTTSDIYTNTPPQSNTVDFKWQAYNPTTKILYTGGSHNHPLNSGPSLTDMFSFNGYYNTLPHDVRKTFAKHHSQTIITDSHNYIVTIKDESTWNAEALKYNRGGQDFKNGLNTGPATYYRDLLKDHMGFKSQFYRSDSYENSRGTVDDFTPLQELYALNKIVGNYMQTFLIDNKNQTIKVVPYHLTADGNLVKINCNN